MGLEQDLKIIRDAELDIELLERDNEKLCVNNNKDISDLEDKIKSTEFIIEEELKVSGEDKLECKFDGYKGSIGWQKMPDKWIYIDEVLMKFIISLPTKLKELFLKTNITIRKADIKKKIIDCNDRLFENSKIIEEHFNTEIGEIFIHDGKKGYKVKGIEIEPQDPKFKYTIKKIK